MSPPSGSESKTTAVDPQRLRVLFALLFSSPEPVTLDRVREVLHPPETGDDERHSPKEYLAALEAWIDELELPLSLHRVGKAWRLLTSEDVSADLATVRKKVAKDRVGPAALEVLSLVAYRQPVLKADIDAIRGVQSGPHLRHLLDLRMVRILGRAEVPGRPFLYGTTREFLDRFGLRDLSDLPQSERLAIPAEPPPQAAGAASGDTADGGVEGGEDEEAPVTQAQGGESGRAAEEPEAAG